MNVNFDPNTDIPLGDPIRPRLGENDPAFVISDDGAEYLAAITRLEESGSTHYLGWYMTGAPGLSTWFASSQDGSVTLGTNDPKTLVMAVYTLEESRVTAWTHDVSVCGDCGQVHYPGPCPQPDEGAYERDDRDPTYWRTNQTDLTVETFIPDPTAGFPDSGEAYNVEDYFRHRAAEGNQAWNENPDGCFFCGSHDHHSDCCPERF